MDIGKEIKQKSFDNNFNKALINLIYTSNKIKHSHNKIFKPLGLQSQHYNVLRIIKGKHPEPVSPGNIKEVMLDKGRDLTRLIDKLEKEKLVTRCLREDNRRMININLTKKGLKTLEKLNKQVEDWSIQYNKLTEKEAGKLSDLLDKLRG